MGCMKRFLMGCMRRLVSAVVREKQATSTPGEPPKLSGEKPNPKCKKDLIECVKDGVFIEIPPKVPKKAIWVEKPNHLRNKLDTLPNMPFEETSTKTQAKP